MGTFCFIPDQCGSRGGAVARALASQPCCSGFYFFIFNFFCQFLFKYMHYLENETLLTTLIQLTFLHTYNTYNMNLLSKTTVTYNNNNTLNTNCCSGLKNGVKNDIFDGITPSFSFVY